MPSQKQVPAKPGPKPGTGGRPKLPPEEKVNKIRFTIWFREDDATRIKADAKAAGLPLGDYIATLK